MSGAPHVGGTFLPRLGLGCVLMIWSAASAPAATVTVATTAELEAAINASQAGDVIELLDGVYPVVSAAGFVVENKSNLTIRGKSGNRNLVVLQGQGINAIATQFVFKLYASPYFTLQDVTMKDVYWHHVQINDGSHHFTLRNLVMLDAGEAPVKVTSPGGSGPFSDYGVIENCWLGFTSYGTRDVVEGIDIIASVGTVVRGNEFYRVRKLGDPDNVGWGVFAKCNAQDTIIENNYFEDNDLAISFGNGGCPAIYARNGDITYQHRGGIIRNNVVHGTKDNAVHINSAAGFKVYNNTLWSTFGYGGSSIDVRYNSYGEVFNNIATEGVRLRDGGTASFAANIWYADASLFLSQSAGNYHLVASALSAIDQGVDTSSDVPTDIDAQVRSSAVGVDIGADEYVGGQLVSCPRDGVLPFACKRPTHARAASVLVRNDADDRRYKLHWMGRAGEATRDFGEPTAATSFAVCVYDENAGAVQLIKEVLIPAGAGWESTSTGYRYRDRKLMRGAVDAVTLRAGSSGRASIRVSAKGLALHAPSLPLRQDPAVTVRLLNDRGCWQARYSSNTNNSAILFKASGA